MTFIKIVNTQGEELILNTRFIITSSIHINNNGETYTYIQLQTGTFIAMGNVLEMIMDSLKKRKNS